MGSVIAFIVFCASWILVYSDSFSPLIRRWESGDYSYCWLVVPLALYVAWQKRDQASFVRDPAVKSGYIFLFISIGLYFLGKSAAIDAVVFLSMWLSLVAVFLLILGWKSLMAMFYPFVILAFAIPPPPFINRLLTFKLRLISSDLSVRIMQFFDVPVFREGNVIDLGIIQLQVVDACSGLRYVFPTILLGLLMGYWFNSKVWQRIIVLIATIPTAIATNALRIALVGFLARSVSIETATNFFHEASGIVVYLVSIIILVCLSLLLNLFSSSQAVSDKSRRKFFSGNIRKVPLHIWAVAILLIGVFFLHSHYMGNRIVPSRLSFDSFPLHFNDFKGKREFFSKEIIESLGADDYFSGVFADERTGRDILVLVSWYNYQEPQRAAHNPVSCLLGGGGWALSVSEDLPPDPESGRNFKVRRMLLEKSGYRLLALYWFQQRGRIITNEYMNKGYLALDSINENRTDGGLVRVEMLLGKNEKVSDAQKILDRFIKNFSVRLHPYIPD